MLFIVDSTAAFLSSANSFPFALHPANFEKREIMRNETRQTLCKQIENFFKGFLAPNDEVVGSTIRGTFHPRKFAFIHNYYAKKLREL